MKEITCGNCGGYWGEVVGDNGRKREVVTQRWFDRKGVKRKGKKGSWGLLGKEG